MIATPIAFANLLAFHRQLHLGLVVGPHRSALGDDHPGAVRRSRSRPLYLFTNNYTVIVVAFVLQGMAGGGGMFGQIPSLPERTVPDRSARDREPPSATTRVRSGAASWARPSPSSPPPGVPGSLFRC